MLHDSQVRAEALESALERAGFTGHVVYVPHTWVTCVLLAGVRDDGMDVLVTCVPLARVRIGGIAGDSVVRTRVWRIVAAVVFPEGNDYTRCHVGYSGYAYDHDIGEQLTSAVFWVTYTHDTDMRSVEL